MFFYTSVLSAWADGQPNVRDHLQSATRLVVPVAALGEYHFGILQSRYRQRYEMWLQENLPLAELAVMDTTTIAHSSHKRILYSHQTQEGNSLMLIKCAARLNGSLNFKTN